tara:strand:+ start:53 stop:1405 length:1353 start_codon:yes stop_codon:yes gene_type:complete
MGLERSEGFYAGLSFVDTVDLQIAGNAKKFHNLYWTAMENLANDTLVKDGTGNATKDGLLKKCNIETASDKEKGDIWNDLAGAISAVIGTRQNVVPKNRIPNAVYLTGNQWHDDIKDFAIKAFGMKDYNSSDNVLKFNGPKDRYVGISLKKKLELEHDSPTLINNAFSKFIEGSKFKDVRDELDEHRIKFFAGLIKEACCPPHNGGKDKETPLEGIADDVHHLNADNYNDAIELWKTKVNRLKPDGKVESIPLINLKGLDEVADGANKKLPTKLQREFRKFINKRLQSTGGKLNPLYKGFQDIMNKEDVKETLAAVLLNRTLKLSLYDELDTWEKNDFSFYLVEGTGRYKDGHPYISPASVFEHGTVMTAVAALAKGKAEMKLNKKETMIPGRAKVFFDLYKANLHLLKIELRYKGDFTAMPQFFATFSNDFKALLHDKKITNVVKGIRP